MSTYEKGSYPLDNIEQREIPLYGIGRLGMATSTITRATASIADIVINDNGIYNRVVDMKLYELLDHLGNVRVVVSDLKLPDGGGSFKADMKSYSNYYPFGMQQPNRSWRIGEAYRFGYNGVESNNEIYGEGNLLATEFRMFDTRLGRWWGRDPIVKVWESPYAGMFNDPINYADPSGLSGVPVQHTPSDNGNAEGVSGGYSHGTDWRSLNITAKAAVAGGQDKGNSEIQVHTVMAGETSTSIAKKYNTSTELLTKWNNIKDKNKIREGTELAVTDPDRPNARKDFESYPTVLPICDCSTVKYGIATGLMTLLSYSQNNYYAVVYLGGKLLERIQVDPDIVKYKESIIKGIESDPRYGHEAFYVTGFSVRNFGGESSSGDWGEFNTDHPLLKMKTWEVGLNDLTWALRHATVKYWAEVGSDGSILIQFNLYDVLDLSPQKGRSGSYNNISTVSGAIWHDLMGGNKNLQTRAWWEAKK